MFLDEDINTLDLMNEGTETRMGNQLIVEALLEDAMVDSGVTILDEDIQFDLLNEELLSEKSIIKFDKKAKRKHATNKAAVIIAKEHNDKDFKKLIKVYKMKNMLLGRIFKKYGNKAKIRVRENERNHGVAKAISKIKNNLSIAKRDM